MRLTVLAAAIGMGVLGYVSTTEAQAAIRRPTDVAPQKLGPALRKLAKEQHFQVLFRSEVVKDLDSAGAAGELTTEEALTRVLAGTGLTYRYLDAQTVTVLRPGEQFTTTDSSQEENQKNSLWDRFRLAQVDQGSSTSFSLENNSRSGSERGSEKLEEVVVTAQKREERLIDVPISIVALSGDELQKRQIRSLDDLPSAVPGLAIQTNGSIRVLELRGISNSVGSNMPLIGMYLDEADVTLAGAYQINPSTYDLERVEVLRGPQGTLYGEGSAGGTIRFITNKPDLSQFAFGSDVAALFTEGGASSQRINAMVNVPLLDGELGFRLAGTFDHEGGWIDQPSVGLKDINGQDLTDVRLKGLWRPSAAFTVSAMAKIYRNDRSSGIGEDSNGNYKQVFNLDAVPRIQDDTDLYNLTLAYDFGAARLLNTATYFRAFNDAKNGGFQYPNPNYPQPGQPFDDYFAPHIIADDHVLEDELRLTSSGLGPWQWTVGAFYRHFHDDSITPTAYYGPSNQPLPTPSAYDYRYLFKDWSAFGDMSYRLADKFTLGAGIRYFKDQQGYTSDVAEFETRQGATFHSVDPRFYAQYKLTAEANVYASAAKGFRSGGFNQGGQPTFAPEGVWTYELGTKMSVRRHLTTDVAIFYSKYTNFQTIGVAPPPNAVLGSITSNAGNARIEGVEVDATWHPGSQWTVSLSGDYLGTRFTRIDATHTNYEVGDGIDYVPKYQYTASGQRDFRVGDKPGLVRLDYSQQGRETYRQRAIAPWYFYESDVIHMLNFSASYWSNRNLRLGIFAQNLLNDRGFTGPLSFELLGARSRPRTYGVEFGVTFD